MIISENLWNNSMTSTKTTPDIPIIYEDDQILIVNKPTDVLSQKDHTGDPDVGSLVKRYMQKKSTSSSTPYVGLIHRLDRPVGGLMMLAKTSSAASALSEQMRDRLMTKTYWAVTTGNPPPNGVLTHYLVKNRNKNVVNVLPKDQPDAKQAMLSFAKLEEAGDFHLLSIHLQTGRPHQIRVQMATEGYPIWGDYKYGHKQPDGRSIALRAVELIFKHPKNGEEVHFELSPPKKEPWVRFNNILF